MSLIKKLMLLALFVYAIAGDNGGENNHRIIEKSVHHHPALASSDHKSATTLNPRRLRRTTSTTTIAPSLPANDSAANSTIPSTLRNTEPAVRVLRAVRNYKAYLPCAPGKIFLDGPEAYVLWLKNDEEVIHRFPNENSWQTYLDPNNLLGITCPEKKCHDGTSLFLPEVTEHDAGQYRCRVHYQNLSSVDYVIDLRVVEASGLPRIYDANRTLITSYIGPLELGTNVTLLCEVVVTQPPTTLFWLRDNAVIARVFTNKPGILQERIHIHAKRDEYKRRYQCTSSNSDVTEPFVSSVIVEMHLPPLSVEIRLNNKYEFEVDQPRVVDCVITGCVPMPTVDWYLNDTLLKTTLHKEIHDGNYTVSSLTLTPPSSYLNKHKLTCKVHNDNSSTAYEDNVHINIGFRPRCFRSSEKVLGVVEGEAETVTCVYEAAPGPIEFSWVFPDSRIINTYGEKVLHERNLFFTKLTWKPKQGDIGILYCRAVNSFGVETVPCSFKMAHGGKPEAPNCLVNESINNTVFCQKGWDGGHNQTIHLEVFSFEGALMQNISDSIGNLSGISLDGTKNLTVNIYATNSRGRSAVSTIEFNAITPTSVDTGYTLPKPPLDATMILFIIVLLGCGFGMVTCLACSLIRIIKKRNNESRNNGAFYREPDFDPPRPTTVSITAVDRSCSSKVFRLPACSPELETYYV